MYVNKGFKGVGGAAPGTFSVLFEYGKELRT